MYPEKHGKTILCLDFWSDGVCVFVMRIFYNIHVSRNAHLLIWWRKRYSYRLRCECMCICQMKRDIYVLWGILQKPQTSQPNTVTYRRMAENGFAHPPREFCRHILSCRELKAESFKRCLHSVLRGVSL